MPWLTRGGQPEKRDYVALYDSGIRLVVNLRLRGETRAIERHAPGLISVHIPVPNHMVPSHEQALKWLHLCQAHLHGLPIYVHCHAGHGRTSVFCSLVRIAQGWDAERAIAEERAYGFDPAEEEIQAAYIRRFSEDVQKGRLQLPGLG